MSSDETRRILRMFGVAVTAFEDAVLHKSSIEEIQVAESEVRARLQEVTSLIERFRAIAARASGSQGH